MEGVEGGVVRGCAGWKWNAKDGREKKGECRQEEGCLHIGEVKGASGVIDDCEMPVEVGSGIGGRRGLKQQKGC